MEIDWTERILLNKVPADLNENANPDLDHKTKRVAEKFTENMNIIANEPSLAFYRIQEHIKKSLPHLVDNKHEVQEIQTSIQGCCFDLEYGINAVKVLDKSKAHFTSIQEHLKNAMFMKQQISYEKTRRDNERQKPSMYRSIGKINSEDSTGRNSPTLANENAPRLRSSSVSSPQRNSKENASKNDNRRSLVET